MSGLARLALAGLTDAVLETAASKGLVRRARRDVEAGLVSVPTFDNGTAVLGCDGETVRLPGGPLTTATCTCPATGACRHVLAAVIALREFSANEAQPGEGPREEAGAADAVAAPPSPTAPDAFAEIRALTPALLAKAFGRAALVRAEALLAALGPADVFVEAEADLVRIRLGDQPEVHVPAGAGPAGAVSKAGRSERAALHAAALLAVLRPEAIGASTEPDAAAASGPLSDVPEAVAAVLRDAARQALSSAPAALEERVGDLVLSSRVDAMPRLAAELRTLAAALRRRRERREEDEPRALLAEIARTYALAEALRTRPGQRALSGADHAAPEPIASTRFVGCGLELWRTGSGARGATAHLMRAADGHPFTLTLARAAGADPGFAPLRAATVEAVFGQTAARLAGAAFALEGGAAGAEARLSPRAGVAVLEPGSWRGAIAAVPGAVFADWDAVSARLRTALRPALGAPGRRGLPLVLHPAAIGPFAFDGVAQVGRLPVADANGAWLELEIAGDERMEGHLDGLEVARQAKEPPLLCVLAQLRGDRVVLAPIAVGGETLRSLDLPPARKGRTLAPSAFSEWAKRFNKAARGARPEEPRFEPVPSPAASRSRAVAEAGDEILALAELGGRMEDPERLGRIERIALSFRARELETPARLLERLAAAPRAERAHHLLVAAYAIDVLARMEPVAPFVRPVRHR